MSLPRAHRCYLIEVPGQQITVAALEDGRQVVFESDLKRIVDAPSLFVREELKEFVNDRTRALAHPIAFETPGVPPLVARGYDAELITRLHAFYGVLWRKSSIEPADVEASEALGILFSRITAADLSASRREGRPF